MVLGVALGMITGGALSAAGWVVSAALLLIATVAGCFAADLAPLVAICAIVAVVFAFNAGLCLGLVPRAVAAGRAPVN